MPTSAAAVTPLRSAPRALPALPSVTVVVPTYREAENLPHLVQRLQAVREAHGLTLDVLFMDDASNDGSVECVQALGLDWVRLVVRTADRGLSQAVLDGLRRATHDVVVVMDADLSHPAEVIPQMLHELVGGAEVVVGSRFVEGGTTDDDWGLFRWLNSRVATLLALPLTHLKDPMSGFFALRRSTFEAGQDFNPVGYKIGLELIIKCRCQKVVEVPIHFTDRQYGTSKLSLKEQLKYLQHLRRLYNFKFGAWSHLAQFLAVGASGVGVNLAALTALLAARVPSQAAVAGAIVVSLASNFLLNRRFSFSYARGGSIVRQFWSFLAACSVGAVINYAVTTALWNSFHWKQAAALVGVVAATALNFLASRYLVFRQRHIT